MVEEVDCAVIHGCDWDTHVTKAAPFIEADKAVLIDKPLAGNMRDLDQLRTWTEQGARITGGSGLRFCAESRRYLDQPLEERGKPDFVLCGCGVDKFNYGIHAYALLASIPGPARTDGASRQSRQSVGSGHALLYLRQTRRTERRGFVAEGVCR